MRARVSVPAPHERLNQHGVRCGNCGGNLFMATCNHFRGTGHEWVLVSVCMVCRAVHWTDEGCHDCRETS
jgi:predicted metal-binding protein